MSEEKELVLSSVYEQRSTSGKNLLVRYNTLLNDELSGEFTDLHQAYNYIVKDFKLLKETYPHDKCRIDIINCDAYQYLVLISRKYFNNLGKQKTHFIKYQIHMFDEGKKTELLDKLKDTFEE